MSEALVIFSGGQDSTTCLYDALDKYNLVHAIMFRYGQRHITELDCAQEICIQERVPYKLVDLDFMNNLVNSALLNGKDDISKKNENDLPASFVPNRNQLFITLAHAYAQKLGIKYVITGVCQTDYSGYPDCRESFIDAIENASNLGSGKYIKIVTPLMYKTKAQIFKMAADLGKLSNIIRFTHTCYEGDRTNFNDWGYGCGKCPACELRAKGWEKFKGL